MKKYILFIGLFACLITACEKKPTANILIRLKSLPLKESPTKTPFPAYTAAYDYLRSEQFSNSVKQKLNPELQEFEITIEQVRGTTLFQISVTTEPEEQLNSIMTVIKYLVDRFGESHGQQFVILDANAG